MKHLGVIKAVLWTLLCCMVLVSIGTFAVSQQDWAYADPVDADTQFEMRNAISLTSVNACQPETEIVAYTKYARLQDIQNNDMEMQILAYSSYARLQDVPDIPALVEMEKNQLKVKPAKLDEAMIEYIGKPADFGAATTSAVYDLAEGTPHFIVHKPNKGRQVLVSLIIDSPAETQGTLTWLPENTAQPVHDLTFDIREGTMKYLLNITCADYESLDFQIGNDLTGGTMVVSGLTIYQTNETHVQDHSTAGGDLSIHTNFEDDTILSIDILPQDVDHITRNGETVAYFPERVYRTAIFLPAGESEIIVYHKNQYSALITIAALMALIGAAIVFVSVLPKKKAPGK